MDPLQLGLIWFNVIHASYEFTQAPPAGSMDVHTWLSPVSAIPSPVSSIPSHVSCKSSPTCTCLTCHACESDRTVGGAHGTHGHRPAAPAGVAPECNSQGQARGDTSNTKGKIGSGQVSKAGAASSPQGSDTTCRFAACTRHHPLLATTQNK